MGVYSAYCVWQTADDALKLDFRVFTARQLMDFDEKTFRKEIGNHEWFRSNTVYFEDYRQLMVS